ncbi:MAG: protein adenylyltransferase SelO family protein, partial [Gammaproteobacteria bacterium]|nr:protein adenylyltransferase SelO family protein [Gammaproteobacteria bacterium]
HGLGIPSSRALCIIGSDTEVYRETIETGALLLRMAPSHIRFGTFEYFYYQQRFNDLKILADYVIQHHYPELRETPSPYLSLLAQVIKSTAQLIARWQSVGFSHGVMNTDNMSIHGITLDYGPFGFLDQYHPGYICNHSDHEGRYAFDRQPDIGLFNLSCLAQALLPLLDEIPEKAAEIAKAELENYKQIFITEYSMLMRRKLGLIKQHKDDQAICNDLLELMQHNHVDYTILFRALSEPDTHSVRDQFLQRDAFDHWMARYQSRLNQDNPDPAERSRNMKQANPKFILRNHLAEIAIQKATQDNDYAEIDTLLKLLQQPFDEHPELYSYSAMPPEWAQDIEVSCSS